VSLDSAAEQAVRNLHSLLDRLNVTVMVGPLPVIAGYESYAIQLFEYLLSSAVSQRQGTSAQIRVAAAPRDAEWVIKVNDAVKNAAEMASDENRDRACDLFHYLQRRDFPGSGIGLAISKKIVEGFGGTIWIETQPDGSYTFCFTLRAAD
jgi:light-regulated signal transduction histidine kinase (bacteriophytochrome)